MNQRVGLLLAIALTKLGAQSVVVPPTPPSFVAEPPRSITEAVGGNVAFSVTIQAGLPYPTFQWLKDGQPISGATEQTLFLPAITEAQAGNYACRATNPSGSATSGSARLKVIPSFTPGSAVDASFALRTSLDAPPRTVVPQADGKILIGGNFVLFYEGSLRVGLARLNPDGSLDPSFNPPNLGTDVNAITLQADGRIAVGGRLSALPGKAASNVVRLQANGTLDTTFTSAVASVPLQLLITPGGKVLVVDGSETLTQLNADGSIDSSFAKSTVPVDFSITGGSVSSTDSSHSGTFNARLTIAAVQPDGKIVVGGAASFSFDYTRYYHIAAMRRLAANGSLDLTFPLFLERYRTGSSDPSAEARAVRILRDGRIMLVTQDRALRFLASGALDSTYTGPTASKVAITGDGKIWLFDSSALKQYDSEGKPDPNFVLQNGFAPTNVTGIFPLDDGRAFIAGDFTQIDTVARARLARVNAAFDSPNPPAAAGLIAPDSVRAGESFTFTFRVTGSPPLRYSVENSPWSDSPTVTLSNAQGRSTEVRAMGAGNVIISTFVGPSVTPSLPVIVRQPGNAPVQVRSGEPITLNIGAYGSDPRTYQWYRNGEPVAGATDATLSIARATSANSGDYTVVIRNTLGVAASTPVHVVVVEPPPPSPVIGQQPGASIAQVRSGDPITLDVSAYGNGPSTYQWYRSGQPIAGATNATLAITGATPADRGDYTVVIRNTLGVLTSTPVHIGVDELPRLANLSIRGWVNQGESTLVTGFVLTGTGGKAILIRGIGPALSSFGVSDSLPSPKLTLFDSSGRVLAENAGWSANAIADAFDRTHAFPLPTGSPDAALVINLAPGAYTAQLSGMGNASGTALLELYEVTTDPTRMTNMSARARVVDGSSAAIPGIVVNGMLPVKLLVRAVGPALTSFGIQDALADPTLSLVGNDGTIVASNNNWADNVDIIIASSTIGTFPLPFGSRDAALITTVAPGTYTALVRGVNDTTGVVLIEVYELP